MVKKAAAKKGAAKKTAAKKAGLGKSASSASHAERAPTQSHSGNQGRARRAPGRSAPQGALGGSRDGRSSETNFAGGRALVVAPTLVPYEPYGDPVLAGASEVVQGRDISGYEMLFTEPDNGPAERRELVESLALQQLPVLVDSSLDLSLQLAIVDRNMAYGGRNIASATADEVAVVARVTDVEQWIGRSDVTPGSVLGKTADGSFVVTARINIDRIEKVHADSNVQSMKASQPVGVALEKTVECMGVRHDLLPQHVSPDGGAGALIGIVDVGGDFAHHNFIDANGQTRLLALWNQHGVAQSGSPFGYGRLHSKAEINNALSAADPYTTLGYRFSHGKDGAHGTHVMDIAAGNGRGSSVSGVAPSADLIFVEVSVNDIDLDGPGAAEQSLGDSVQMLEAVRFIFDQAGEQPCVVNLSLGTFGGPHDGTSLVEQGIDAMVAEKPGRAVVIAAGNAYGMSVHASGRVASLGTHDLVIDVKSQGAEVEIWYAGGADLEMALVAPDGTAVLTATPGTSDAASSSAQVVAFASNRLNDPNNQCNVIGVWLAPGIPSGRWTIQLRSVNGTAVDYHAWIERCDGDQSTFLDPVESHTLGSISNGQASIVVGSFDAHKTTFPVSWFTSSGPTRDGREKPELSAPGHDVRAARSGTKTGVVRMSGTSMAAPAVTGLVALMYAEAQRKNAIPDIATLRKHLRSAAIHTNSGGWDPQLGHGMAHF